MAGFFFVSKLKIYDRRYDQQGIACDSQLK